MFVYHHFADYIANLLSLHEQIMDDVVDDCFHDLGTPALVRDVFDAEFVREFKGPDGKTLFVEHL